jgi:predicted small integral membrane protein
MDEMLVGGIAVGSFVAGLFFLRYWRSTGDRFFLFFMLSFWIEAANRVHMAMNQAWTADAAPVHYLVRLVSYGLILWAIWEKNRPTDE